MKSRIAINPRFYLYVLSAVLLFAVIGPVAAQDEPAPGDHDRKEMHRQISDQINQAPALNQQVRERMMNNLEASFQHGLSIEEIRALFPEEGIRGTDHAEQMLAMQDHVIGLADMDLPVGLMMEKLMEGRMKHVPAGRMEPVLEQTANNIQLSRRMMIGAMEGGVRAPGTDAEMQEGNSALAHCLWDGLTEQDLERLREQAMDRARDRGCSMDEFVASAETANRFAHGGMNHDRAVAMAGEALQNGYSADDLRTMGYMMMSGSEMGEHHAEMMNRMQSWIGEGMSMDEMTRHMMEGGWMGPADMMGPGGHNGMDDMGWSGPGHDGGGSHEDGDHGGMGGGNTGGDHR